MKKMPKKMPKKMKMNKQQRVYDGGFVDFKTYEEEKIYEEECEKVLKEHYITCSIYNRNRYRIDELDKEEPEQPEPDNSYIIK